MTPAGSLVVLAASVFVAGAAGAVKTTCGSLVGAIDVSGAPGGDADEACAKAGLEAIRGKLDF